MSENRPILLTLTPRHFSPPRGKAYPVTIRHPEMHRRLSAGRAIRLWDGTAWCGQDAASVEEVVERGAGRCFIEMRPIWLDFPFNCDPGGKGVAHPLTTIWISLPDDSDPRERDLPLVMQVDKGERSVPPPGPLLILGPQRSGTTALQVALHLATRYRAPTDINRHSGNTLEGFHFAQVAHRLVAHRLLTCFGTDARQTNLCTGLFDDSGMADFAAQSLADHVMRMYNLSACSDGHWTDKCPGWEATTLGPLFAAMFPGARVIFMRREPVSCALSIARLEGALPTSLEDERSLRSIARNSAVWTVSHLLWRRYGRSRLPESTCAEVSFEQFREQPRQVEPRISALLGLSGAEAGQFIEALGRVQLPRHPIDQSALDPRVAALIRRLCRGEAGRWLDDDARDEGESIELDESVVAEACKLFRVQLDRMLAWHAVAHEVAAGIGERLIEAARRPQTPVADEPLLPAAGPLLSARLALHGALRAPDSCDEDAGRDGAAAATMRP